MIEAAEVAARFIAGRTRSDLETDQMLLFALVRAIEVIGEAPSKVSQSTRDTAPSVPWTQIAAMRNRLIHAYFDTDRDILWNTATQEVPALLANIRPLATP